eukprot:4191594-Pleurochrysis_carterae.AAC.2
MNQAFSAHALDTPEIRVWSVRNVCSKAKNLKSGRSSSGKIQEKQTFAHCARNFGACEMCAWTFDTGVPTALGQRERVS